MQSNNTKVYLYFNILLCTIIVFYGYTTTTVKTSIYAESTRVPNVPLVTSETRNISSLDLDQIRNNNKTVGTPIPLPRVSVENLSQVNSTASNSSIGSAASKEESSRQNINEHTGSEEESTPNSNTSSLAGNRVFSLSDLPRNSSDWGFQGISWLDADVIHASGEIPQPADVPDPQIAVGQFHIVEMVNAAIAYFKKGGDMLKASLNATNPGPIPLQQFFHTGKDDYIVDPRIVYDNSTKRWFALILDATDRTIRLSISSPGDDPIKTGWDPVKISFDDCPDQPSIGISRDKVVIVANTMGECEGGTFKGSQFVVYDKTDLVNGGDLTKLYKSHQYAGFFSLRPARMTDSNETSDLYLAKIGGDWPNAGGNVTTIIKISGKVPSEGDNQLEKGNFTIINATLSIQNIIAASRDLDKGVEQLGLDGVDNRVTTIDPFISNLADAYWHDGKLWLAENDRCTPKGDSTERNCIRLIQLDTKNFTTLQDFDVGARERHLFFPALAVDSAGNLGIIVGVSSRNEHPGLLATTKYANSPRNTLDNQLSIITSLDVQDHRRFGDYLGIVVDPANPREFWAVGQFTPVSSLCCRGDVSHFWSTYIANFTAQSTPRLPSP